MKKIKIAAGLAHVDYGHLADIVKEASARTFSHKVIRNSTMARWSKLWLCSSNTYTS